MIRTMNPTEDKTLRQIMQQLEVANADLTVKMEASSVGEHKTAIPIIATSTSDL